MKSYRNLMITGSKNSGKTTLANWLLEQFQKPFVGYRTLPATETEAGPLYKMQDLSTGNEQLISAYVDGRIRGIPSAFEEFGVQVLKNALENTAPVILLDEIGRFEKNCEAFLENVFAIADSEKFAILILKKENLAHIQKLKEREDSLVIDLDEISREDARSLLQRHVAEAAAELESDLIHFS